LSKKLSVTPRGDPANRFFEDCQSGWRPQLDVFFT
jgi:hypothetical protein